MPSIFSTMSQNHLRLRSWAILSTPSGPSTRCMDLQKPQLRWVILYCFGHLFEFSFNSKMSSLCIEPKNKITEHYKSQQLTACTACFMHYIIQCNAQCNALCNTNCELSLIDRVQSIVYWFQIGSINYSMHIYMYMCTCILRDIFTSIFSSSFVGPNIPQRRGHYAAGVGKAEAPQGKETFEHQRCPDQGGHD